MEPRFSIRPSQQHFLPFLILQYTVKRTTDERDILSFSQKLQLHFEHTINLLAPYRRTQSSSVPNIMKTDSMSIVQKSPNHLPFRTNSQLYSSFKMNNGNNRTTGNNQQYVTHCCSSLNEHRLKQLH